MKFLVFGYDQYYPLGGWDDLLGIAKSLEDAISLVAKQRYRYDYTEIVDLSTYTVVWANGEEVNSNHG